ncbi:MAG TPA: type IV pilin protein, partial [Nitrococcus sp.]|nr:type IV pilin protein [Nitrococcus sp.]
MRKGTGQPYSGGFSLIELMITIAIVAIIATIAYPSYTSHVMKAHRSTGQSKLLEIMQAEERYFTAHDTYTTGLKTDLGYDNDPVPADGGWYTVAA